MRNVKRMLPVGCYSKALGVNSVSLSLFLVLLGCMWYQSRYRPRAAFGSGMFEGFSELRSEPDLSEGTPCVSKSGKPQSVFFSMTGCPHCDKVKPDWQKYASGATDVETRHFEVNAAPNVCKKYGVSGFPTFLQLDAKGNVLSKDRPF